MEVQVKALREALEVLKPVIPRKPSINVLRNVLLKDGKIAATDLDIWAVINLPGAEEACLIPYTETLEVLKAVPGYNSLSIQAEGKRVLLSWDGGKATFDPGEAEDYPPIPQITPVAEGAVDGSVLVAGLLSIVEYCATETTRPILNGVWLTLGERIEVAAGDGFRLAYRVLPLGFPHSEGVTIPARTVKVLGHLWQKALPSPDITKVDSVASLATARRPLQLALSADNLQVSWGAVRMIAKLLQGTPPNYIPLIPKDAPTTVKLMATDLERAVRQVEGVAHSGSDTVRLVWGENTLRVSAKADEKGETEASVPIMVEGGAGKVAINARYLLSYLKGKQGLVTMGVKDPASPVLLRHGSAPVVVLMPMNVQWEDTAPASQTSQAEQPAEASAPVAQDQEAVEEEEGVV